MSKITTERHYKITLTDGSTYYGRTAQSGNDRYSQHRSTVRRGVHDNKNIQESYNKYGYDGWIHEWLGYETGDKLHHDKIEFGYIQADPKSLNILDGRVVLLTTKEHNKRVRNKMTPKELEKDRRKDRDKQRKRRLNETLEQKEIRLMKMREYYHRSKEIKRSGDNK